MQKELLEKLREITEEEKRILNGEAEVDRDLYTSGKDFTVDSSKMLEEGKLMRCVPTHDLFIFLSTGIIMWRFFMSVRDPLPIL